MTQRTISSIYQALPYGWGVCFGLQVEGLQWIFMEGDVNGTDPTGYTQEVGSLVVDDSARLGSVVDLDSGISRAYELTFGLRRSAATSALFRRPTVLARLALDLADTETTALALVEDPGFSSSGIVYIGRESIGYAFQTAAGAPSASGFDELGGLTRGSPNGDFRAYDHPVNSQISTWVTDSPLYWRGRRATLWAIPVDPYGNNHGTDVLDGAAQVFVGHVSGRPKPTADGWDLSCESLDRRLTREVGSSVSGQATWDLVADPLVEVDEDWTVHLRVVNSATGWPGLEFDITPFATGAASPLSGTHRLSALRQSFVDEWNAVAAGVTDVGDGHWVMEADEINAAGSPVTRAWRFLFEGSTTLATKAVHVKAAGMVGLITGLDPGGDGGYSPTISTFEVPTSPSTTLVKTRIMTRAAASVAMLRVGVTDGDPTELESTGYIMLELGGGRATYEYDSLELDGSAVLVTTVPGSGPSLSAFAQQALEDLSVGEVGVRFGLRDSGLYKDMARRMLAASGRGDNDVTWDTQPAAAGYDLEVVDWDAFDVVLDGGWSLAQGVMSVDEEVSWEKTFGNLLALSGRGMAMVDNGDGLLLTPVRTTVYDTGLADQVTVTDADLVILDSGEPVRAVERPEGFNSVVVKHTDASGQETAPHIVNDPVAKKQEGPRKREIEVLGAVRATLDDAVTAWARTSFAQRHGSYAYEIDVHPGVDVQVGQTFALDSSHYAFETRETGLQGYTGPVRCFGRQLNPRSGVLTLSVLTQGVYRSMALSPSAEVVAHTGSTIDVDASYQALLSEYLTSGGGSFIMTLYDPSADAGGNGFSFDAVTLVGSVTRLDVLGIVGTPPTVVDGKTRLTLPNIATSNDSQDRHVHIDTPGAVWR